MNMKLDQLRRSATDARDAAHSASHHLADLEAQLHEARRPETQARAGLQPDAGQELHDRIKDLQHQIERARTDLEEVRELADAEARVLEEATRVVNHPFLRHEPVDQPEVDHDLEALIGVRDEIGDIKSQLLRLEQAPPSREETLADLRRQVHNMAEAPCLNPDGRLVLPTNAAALQAWLDPDRLVQALAETLPIPDGPSRVERDAQREALATRLLDLERREEALVMAARAEGVMVPRRPDADPRAVLGVVRAEPEEQAA